MFVVLAPRSALSKLRIVSVCVLVLWSVIHICFGTRWFPPGNVFRGKGINFVELWGKTQN